MNKAQELLDLFEVNFEMGPGAKKGFSILGVKPISSVKSLGIVSYGTGLEEIDAVLLKKLGSLATFTGVSFNKMSKLEVMFDDRSDEE